jgi:hypothetical protein
MNSGHDNYGLNPLFDLIATWLVVLVLGKLLHRQMNLQWKRRYMHLYVVAAGSVLVYQLSANATAVLVGLPLIGLVSFLVKKGYADALEEPERKSEQGTT